MSTNTPIYVEALSRQRYKGIWYVPGESFEVDSEAEADDMQAIRPPLVKRVAKPYENRAMGVQAAQAESGEAAPRAQVASASKAPAAAGKYDRRDVRAR